MERKQRILIFDDERDGLEIYTKVLSNKGYEVFTRAHCLDCLDVVGFFHPDVIFMDHNMPGKCGLEATAALKSHAEFRQIPVIYFSSNDELEKLARKAGADAYLPKPCNMKMMEDAIQQAINMNHH